MNENSMYLGNQVECKFGVGRCYGLLADEHFLLVCGYGENGADPEIVICWGWHNEAGIQVLRMILSGRLEQFPSI